MSAESLFNRAWYGKSKWTYLFLPVYPLVKRLVRQKRERYLAKAAGPRQFDVPVIVVGNITVGGTGKSPMVLALIKELKHAGYHPGVVSRGYGVSAAKAMQVTPDSLASDCGDEPVMLARLAKCPLVICQNRVEAISLLLKDPSVDLVISDDGMQHYAMQRDIEFLMLDENRGLGNGKLLPIGPLREPASRIEQVDFVVSLISGEMAINGSEKVKAICRLLFRYLAPDRVNNIQHKIVPVTLDVQQLTNVKTGEKADLSLLGDVDHWHVMAGIGNPERFLNTLLDKGLSANYSTHWFVDHHQFTAQDINANGHVVMTEKDAVKCKDLALENDNVWFLPIEVTLPTACVDSLIQKLKEFKL